MLISIRLTSVMFLLLFQRWPGSLAVNQHLTVYVSKAHGSDFSGCGSVSKPCKTLAGGFDVLLPGGHLYVDGEQTERDPYNCNGVKLVINKGFTMTSGNHGKTAYVSCSNGITVNPKYSLKALLKSKLTNYSSNRYSTNPENVVIFNRINFKKMTVVLEGATAVIKNCIFLEGSPALRVLLMQSMPADQATLNVTDSVFKKNHGCIQVYTTHNRCKTLYMNLQSVVFTENSGNPTGVIHVDGPLTDQYNTCPLTVTINNVTVYGNQALATNNVVNHKRKQRVFRRASCMKLKQLFQASRNKPRSVCHTVENFIEIRSKSVTLQINNTKSKANSHMRFLKLNSRFSSVNITNSSFHGHYVNGSGGVLLFASPEVIRLSVQRSIFDNNVAEESGGVLSIQGQIKLEQKVVLTMIDTTIVYSYGMLTGCAVDTGKPESVYVKFDRFVFQHCHAPCKGEEGECRKYKKASLCITTGKCALVDIQNSLFSHNLNKYQPTLAIRLKYDKKNQKHNFQTYIRNVTFTKNTSPSVVGMVQVILDAPYELQQSLVRIANSTFSENTGKAMEVNRSNNVQIENVTCINNNGMCVSMKNHVVKDDGPFNVNVLIRNCLFENNGVPLVIRHTRPQNTNITIKNTIFRKNVFNGKEGIKIKIGYKKTLDKENDSIAGNLTLDHVQFTENKVNFASGSVFGIAIFSHNTGLFNATIRNTLFKDNAQDHRKDRTFVSDLVYLYLPNPQTISCKGTIRNKCKLFKFPIVSYLDHVTFERVIFENNTVYSNVIYINNGKTTFRRCLFKNNFSYHPRTGVYVFAEQGLPSLQFESCVFNQTQIRILPHSRTENQPQPTNIMPFIYFAGHGPFVIKDSHFMITASEEVTPMFILQNGRFVHFDETTQFSCPVGSYIKLDNSSHIIPADFTYCHCPLNITRLKFTCRRCPVSTYSLQRGILRGTALKKSWIDCNKCPYGGNCMKNVISRRSFWGYEIQKNPPRLKFEHCPVNYCLSPSTTNPAIFNHCHGNRAGVMCGSCKRGFTESMFNHKCRPKNDCRDGWFWIIAALYSTLMALHIMYQPSMISFLTKKLLWFRETSTNPPPPNSRVEQIKQLGCHKCYGYSKVVFYFYQIAKLIMLESVTEIMRRDSYISIFVSFYNFHVELVDDSLGCPFPGLGVVTKELFRSVQVYLVMVWIVFFYLVAYLLHIITGHTKPLIAHYVAAIVEVLLLGYERLGHTSLELLSCTPLKMNGRTEWRLFLDGNITCWVHWWQYGLIAYNVIFIIPFLVVLLVGTTKLRHQQISPWTFVVACFIPLPFLICWGLVWMISKHCKRKQHALRSGSNLKFQTTFSLLNVLQGPFRSPDSQPGAQYWESVLIGRRLVFLCLRSFIASPMIRLLCMTIACIMVLVHNIITLPYKDKKANYFSIVALFTLVTIATINLTKASFIATGVQPMGMLLHVINVLQKCEVVLLAVLPGSFGLLVIAVLISQTVRLVFILKEKFIHTRTKENTFRVNLNSDYSDPLLGNCTESSLKE